MSKTKYNCTYLAGAMSGKRQHNYPKFFKYEKKLQEAGHIVINPARLNKAGEDWSSCLRNDLYHIVTKCGTIALLDDWFISRGARLELATALQLGMKIISAHTLKELDITRTTIFTHRRRNGRIERYKG
jgi:Domain of unknown function (DUF4406)